MEKELIEGKTPNGGVKAEIYYMNDNEEMVDKKKATRVVIRELDENNNLIFESWGIIGNSE